MGPLMARMSIDDKFPRDPRVIRLGKRFGWSRRETMGALIDVFQIAYDRVQDIVPAEDIDTTAERDGFAAAMIEVDLAEQTRAGVRIKGAADRINYLTGRADAGRSGGVKSGESRRNKREAKRSTASEATQAAVNPPDPVPDVAPDPSPEDQRLSLPRAIPPGTEQGPAPAPPAPPAVPPPPPVREVIAGTQPVAPAAYDQHDAFSRGRLAESTWRRISDASIAIAAELKIPAPLPFPAITPSSVRAGYRDLLARIREEGELAPAACDRTVANLIAQARAKRSVEWLAEKVFGERAWLNARNGVDPSARAAPASGSRYGPQPGPPAPRIPDPGPPVITVSADARADAHAELAIAQELLGIGPRAPPAIARPPTDEEPTRKARA